MTIEAISGNLGQVVVTLSARADAPLVRASRRRSTAKRGKISTFSAKSRTRFRRQLETSAIPFSQSVVVTLNFPGAGPQEAKKEYAAFIRLAKKRLPGAFGWHSVEFKASGLLHLHVLLCAPANQITEIMALRAEFQANFPSLAYMRPMISMRSWLRYIAKHDHQRNIPRQFAGKMSKFWGSFGRVPRLPSTCITLPEAAQGHARRAVAGFVAEQGGERSHGFANAVAASSGRVSVLLSPGQSAKFMNPLIIVFSRQRRGPKAQQGASICDGIEESRPKRAGLPRKKRGPIFQLTARLRASYTPYPA